MRSDPLGRTGLFVFADAGLRTLDGVGSLPARYPGWMFDFWVVPKRVPG